MTASKHTPGPWSYIDHLYGHDAIHGADGRIVAHVFGDDAQAQEDARLIAAAPELLDALKDALCVLEISGAYDYVTGRARAAITKSTGVEP